MSTVRRCYIYLISAISLQGVTWAVISLLRNLLIKEFGPPTSAIAFQIAVILVGLPIFLAHWLWGQRLAGQSAEERSATLRSVYLYGNMTAFLAPALPNLFDLVARLLRAKTFEHSWYLRLSAGSWTVFHLIPMLVLSALWFYHWRVEAGDTGDIAGTEGAATIRRLYRLVFSATGLAMTTAAVINLSRWLMMQIGSQSQGLGATFASRLEIVRLVVGVPLWLAFWWLIQQSFGGESEVERDSVLRKLYLYGAVFIGAMGVVGSATATLAGFFRRLLITRPAFGTSSGDDVRVPLSIIIGMGLLWVYHAYVIRGDSQRVADTPRQAGIRRLYLYLVAAVGLAVLLSGLAGIVSVLIRSIEVSFGNAMREQLAWCTAAIIAGIPVWLIPWRQLQNQATLSGTAGANERRSTIRKIYLYLFLFVATMTMLSCTVFFVYRILSVLLVDDSFTISELAQAIAYSMIAAGVWLYHGSTLRRDQRLLKPEESRAMKTLRLAIVDLDDGVIGRALVEALAKATPELVPDLILADALGGEVGISAIITRLSEADAIIGPWTLVDTDKGTGLQFGRVLKDSSARKVLIPTRMEGWEWAGVSRFDTEALVSQSVKAVKQIASGEEIRTARPVSLGAIIGIVVGALAILPLVLGLVFAVLFYLYY